MKADTGATSTYIRENDTSCAHSFKTLKDGPTIMQPDTSTLTVNKQCTLPLHNNISNFAKSAYVVPRLKNSSLLSIGKLCDDNCIAMFTKTNLFVFKNNLLLLQGFRNKYDGLWDILFPKIASNTENTVKTKNHSINYIIQADKTKTELAKYLHACCFSPCISTFSKAINNGNFISWPGINSINFKKILPTTIATEKGHLDQERSNLQSTKLTTSEETDKDFFPPKDRKTNECIFKLINTKKLNNKSYMDLCGRFPYTSSRGSKYILECSQN